MNHRLFGEVMELVHLDPYYAKVATGLHTNSLYYAVKHEKCLQHRIDGGLVGFCTYGFFTPEELETDTWDGDVVYSREAGEVLHFPKFQCRLGRREVFEFVRGIQDFMFENHPGVAIGNGLRRYADGRSRDEKWYRKSK